MYGDRQLSWLLVLRICLFYGTLYKQCGNLTYRIIVSIWLASKEKQYTLLSDFYCFI